MFMSDPRAARRAALFFVAACLCLLLSPAAATARRGQNAPPQEDERARAMRLLWNDSRAEEALPLLEKLAAARPEDGEVIFSYGMALMAHAKLLKDADARRETRVRARNLFVKAKGLGVSLPLLTSLLETVPPDGGPDDVFSLNKEADGAMRDGEAAYVRGDFAAAAESYQRALAADPKLYEAALFAGDMFYKLDQYDKAAEWYGRAVQINPDRETAYRYSASPLMRQHKYEEAKARYVEALIAEPYNRLARGGLAQWAEATGARVGNPRINIPASVSPLQDNKITINIDPSSLGKDDGSSAWMMYGITRSMWATKKFAEAYPAEKTYRHSLREEADALRAVVESVKTQQKEGKIKTLSPDLALLVRLADAGLIEPYVLMARPDEGIAHDYADYRKANRDKLRRYVLEYVIGGGQQ